MTHEEEFTVSHLKWLQWASSSRKENKKKLLPQKNKTGAVYCEVEAPLERKKIFIIKRHALKHVFFRFYTKKTEYKTLCYFRAQPEHSEDKHLTSSPGTHTHIFKREKYFYSFSENQSHLLVIILYEDNYSQTSYPSFYEEKEKN